MSKCWKVLDDIYTSSGTFDIFVVTTGLGFLTQRLALRIAGDEGSDSDAVLSAHDALGRCHVNLKYFTLTKYFKTRLIIIYYGMGQKI